MPAPIAHEIRDRLARYLDQSITLSAFSEWFTPATWEVETDIATEKLIGDIQLLLAEFDHGDWTEDELRVEIAKLTARPIVTVLSELEPRTTSTSKTRVLAGVSLPPVAIGKPLVTTSG
jgi:hypothetical protein